MKERLIDVSIKLFLRKGFNGTSIQDITGGLKISKGAFYWHFKSKDELLETIIGKYEKEFLDKMLEHIGIPDGDFQKNFRKYHRYISEYARENSELCVLFTTLAAEMAGSETDAEKRIKEVHVKYLHFIENLLELGKKDQLFSKELDLKLIAHIIVAIHNGILLQWYMNKNTIDGSLLAKTYRDVILYGIIHKGIKNRVV